MDADAGLVLFDADAMTVGDEPIASRARPKSIEQHHLQIAAMDRELRMLVACRAAQRLLIDQLAEAIEEGRVPGFDRDACQRLLKSKRGKFFCCVREQIDADTDRPDLGGRLEYPAGNAALVQRKSERQSANAGSDDDDVVHLPSRRALRRLRG